MSEAWGAEDTLGAPDPERQRRARERARVTRRLLLADLAIVVAGLAVITWSGAAEWLRDRLEMHWALQAPAYTGVLVAGYGVLTFPLDLYGGFILPRRYGLLTQSFAGWMKDRARAAALAALMGLALVEILYGLLHAAGGWWWAWTALAYTAVSILLTVIGPTVIFPIFYHVRPLEDPELTGRIERLAARAGARLRGVYTWEQSAKGTTANAALMGLGRTRRVVLSDTLLRRYSHDEIEVILAHELGHHVHRDIPKGVLVGALTTFASFWLAALVLDRGVEALGLRGVQDIAAFPLLALVVGVFGFMIGPLTKLHSRYTEARADIYALEATRKPAQFVSMMAKLTDQNLGEAEPPAWARILFYDHPTAVERIALARRFEASVGGA